MGQPMAEQSAGFNESTRALLLEIQGSYLLDRLTFSLILGSCHEQKCHAHTGSVGLAYSHRHVLTFSTGHTGSIHVSRSVCLAKIRCRQSSSRAVKRLHLLYLLLSISVSRSFDPRIRYASLSSTCHSCMCMQIRKHSFLILCKPNHDPQNLTGPCLPLPKFGSDPLHYER